MCPAAWVGRGVVKDDINDVMHFPHANYKYADKVYSGLLTMSVRELILFHSAFLRDFGNG